jgi:Fe-Mn family superoxide dismutase
MSFEFKDLPYDFAALEPHIDAQTMELHYSKHHKGYFDKFLKAIEGSELENLDLDKIFSDISKLSAGVRNNGGGYFNHELFWSIMSPNGGGEPDGQLLKAIESEFETFNKFADTFSNAAATRFGSGWAWLLVGEDKKLKVASTPNQDNPLMDVSEVRGTPILGLDVWEHAYYLKYQNRRPEYITAWWNVINWQEVNKNFEKALEG